MDPTIDLSGSTENGERLLSGALVQRVHLVSAAPNGDKSPVAQGDSALAVVLRVRRPGETAFVVVAPGKRSDRIGIVTLEMWRAAALGVAEGASAEKARWRAQLEGAKIVALTGDSVALEREGRALIVVPPAVGSVVVKRDSARDESALHAATAATTEDREAWLVRGAELLERLASGSIEARRAQLRRALDRTVQRLTRRAEAIRGDRAKVAEAGDLAAVATAFVAAAKGAARGARALSVTDWSTGEAREVTLPLDPSKPARAQIDAMFKRAKRLKLGGVIVEARLRETESALAAIDALRPLADAAESVDALDALRDDAVAAAKRDFALATPKPTAGSGRASRAGEKPPYRTFTSTSGARILVGRGAAHNDTLTLHVAKPHDLWLHVKGRAGAHVVVPLAKKHACPGDVLVEAAHLAAHFSDAREDVLADVQYTPRRFLRKPRGSAPGAVIVDREKVIALRKNEELLATLLACEEPL